MKIQTKFLAYLLFVFTIFGILAESKAQICADISISPEYFKFDTPAAEGNDLLSIVSQGYGQLYHEEITDLLGKINIDFKQDGNEKSIRLDFPKEPGLTSRCTLVKGKIFQSDKPISNIRVSINEESKTVTSSSVKWGAGPESHSGIPLSYKCEPTIVGPVNTKQLTIELSRNSKMLEQCKISALVIKKK